jgi:hypothetical protein
MADPPLRRGPSQATNTAIGRVVLVLGILAGAGGAMWFMPPV